MALARGWVKVLAPLLQGHRFHREDWGFFLGGMGGHAREWEQKPSDCLGWDRNHCEQRPARGSRDATTALLCEDLKGGLGEQEMKENWKAAGRGEHDAAEGAAVRGHGSRAMRSQRWRGRRRLPEGRWAWDRKRQATASTCSLVVQGPLVQTGLAGEARKYRVPPRRRVIILGLLAAAGVAFVYVIVSPTPASNTDSPQFRQVVLAVLAVWYVCLSTTGLMFAFTQFVEVSPNTLRWRVFLTTRTVRTATISRLVIRATNYKGQRMLVLWSGERNLQFSITVFRSEDRIDILRRTMRYCGVSAIDIKGGGSVTADDLANRAGPQWLYA